MPNRLITFRFGTARITGRMLDNNEMWLNGLFAIQRGQGHATGVMKKAVDFAERNGIVLTLVAQQYGHPPGMNNQELVAFYERFGFLPISKKKPVFMRRELSQKIHPL